MNQSKTPLQASTGLLGWLLKSLPRGTRNCRMRKKKWKPSSVTALIGSQALGALNDNAFRLLITFHVIALVGVKHTQSVTSIAGLAFVAPFLLFSVPAGWLADRCSKRYILWISKFAEIPIAIGGLLAITSSSPTFAYIILFLMAFQSTFFSPSKYGIIPELVDRPSIARANSWLSFTTFLGIILGTFFGSLLTDVSQHNLIVVAGFCLAIACVGSVLILYIHPTPAENPHKPFPKTAFLEPFFTLRLTRQYLHLTPIIFCSMLFLFIGSYTQINILPYSVHNLNLPATYGGYLFLMTALGIGFGSLLSGLLSKKAIELGVIPLAIFFMGLGFLSLYLIEGSVLFTALSMLILGVLGGLIIVPIESFIQAQSPKDRLGQVLACTNFFNFIGLLIASLLLYAFHKFFHFSPRLNFACMGIFLLLISVPLLRNLRPYVDRLLYRTASLFSPKLTIDLGALKESGWHIFLEEDSWLLRSSLVRELHKYDVLIMQTPQQLDKAGFERQSSRNYLCFFPIDRCISISSSAWKVIKGENRVELISVKKNPPKGSP